MASSSEDQQSQSKATDLHPPPPPSAGNNNPPIYPPPTVGYPHGHVYPPAMGSAPLPGYPPSAAGNYPPYNSYPYAQAPPAAYHNNPQHYRVETVNRGFIRGILAAIILLGTIMIMSSIITWIVLRPVIPIFRVDSFSVANFSISKSNYSGNWDGNVTVQNPNHRLNLNFERIQSFLDFRDNTLAISSVESFFLDVEKSSQMSVKLTSTNPDDPENWGLVEDKFHREKTTGTVSFNLRFYALSTFRSGAWWTRRVPLRIFCDDLKLVFAGPAATNAAFLPGAQPQICTVIA